MSTGTGSMNGIAHRTGTAGVASLLLRGVFHWYFGDNNNNAHDSNSNNDNHNNHNHNHNQNQRQLLIKDRYLGDVNVYEDYDYSEARVGKYDYSNFNVGLLVGTIFLCLAITIYVIIRIKCHRHRQTKRMKLGMPSIHTAKRTRSTKKKDTSDDNMISEAEIHKYVLPVTTTNSYDDAMKMLRYDNESIRIVKLCKPFWIDAAVSSVCDILNASMIGRGLGVDALAIYYVVEVPTTFTYTIISAVLETVSTLGGQSIGVGSYKLTGQYCQISIVLYTILYIPHAILWILYLKPTLRWFAPDLDENIIEEGYKYFIVGLVSGYIEAFSWVLHTLLEVTDHAGYGTKSGCAHNIISVIAFYLYLKINPEAKGDGTSLVSVSIMWFVLSIVFLIIDLVVVKKKRWFDDFWKGMLRSVAIKNWDTVWLVLRTAAPISVGNVLLTVEWELLALFAATLGGNQVAAWGIVGSIWGVLEYVTTCVAAAGEIRVAKLLGNGNPRLAKLSAYKCLFLGNSFASIMSIVFLTGIPWLPAIFTDDEDLQQQVAMVLPYCAIGNFTLALGSIAWTLVGAQGRYNIATFHGCIGSLLVTIPCACISIFYFQWGLPSLAASVVIGYMVSGAFNTITLLLSDWEYISYKVMILNGATEPVEGDENDEDDEDDDYEDDDDDDVNRNRWNLLDYMSNNTGSSNESKNSYRNNNNNDNKSTSFISVSKNTFPDDSSVHSTSSISTSGTAYADGTIKKSSTLWSTFGMNCHAGELRKVVLGPGKLGYTIQSTNNGPMVGADALMERGYGLSYRGYEAKNIVGELHYGDIIVSIDKQRCDGMSGKDITQLLNEKRKQRRRDLIVSHREGTGLGAAYQPGPYGTAALAALRQEDTTTVSQDSKYFQMSNRSSSSGSGSGSLV